MDESGVQKRRARGPTDPRRRDKIARAAIDVVAKYGVDSLSHRKVAASAGVALGSTTYYFATLDELMEAALAAASADDVIQLRQWAETEGAKTDLPSSLADYIIESLTERRPETLGAYNLYALALCRPKLRAAAVQWDMSLSEVFIELTDQVTGRMLTALVSGMLLQGVLHDEVPTRSSSEEVIRRAVEGAGASRIGA